MPRVNVQEETRLFEEKLKKGYFATECDTLGMLMKDIYDEHMKRKADVTGNLESNINHSGVMEEILNDFLMK